MRDGAASCPHIRTDPSDTATAVNTAVRLGATEVSNSYGGQIVPTDAATLRAYDHPGVVITASTGDQGWFGWTNGLFADAPRPLRPRPGSDINRTIRRWAAPADGPQRTSRPTAIRRPASMSN
jgi:hypothetical protein